MIQNPDCVFTEEILMDMGYQFAAYPFIDDLNEFLKGSVGSIFVVVGYNLDNTNRYIEIRVAGKNEFNTMQWSKVTADFIRSKSKSMNPGKGKCPGCDGEGERLGGWFIPMMHKCTDCGGTGYV